MATKSVLIGGGTGLIGSALANALRRIGNVNVHIVSRSPGPSHMTWMDVEKSGLPENTVAVFSLSGQNVFDFKRMWTPAFQQNIYSSRVNTTKMLANAIERAEKKPDVFVSISGVGYYKPSEKAEYDESSPGGDFDFLSKLATEWEGASKLSEKCKDVRRVIVRSGVVLAREGGVIQQLYWPTFFGLGGPIGDGSHFFPWIQINDLVGLFLYIMDHKETNGVYNGVAPQIITNKEFAKAFGRAMVRPAFFPMPPFVLNMVFGEERAKIMTEGQRVLPKRTLASGFTYDHPDIESALRKTLS